jgi:hypothetical protein
MVHDADQRSKSNTHRLDKMEERQDNLDKLVTSVSVMAEKQDRMETDIGEIKTDVRTMAQKPAKRWESVVDKVIMVLVGAIAAYAVSKLGF